MTKPDEIFVELAATVIGWFVCMGMTSGAYVFGYWLAPFFGGQEHRDTFGLLSAIAFIWLYEHRDAHDRWEKLKDRLDHLARMTNDTAA